MRVDSHLVNHDRHDRHPGDNHHGTGDNHDAAADNHHDAARMLDSERSCHVEPAKPR